jgi:hypothetical protein
MTNSASSKTKGSLTAKMFLIISGSCLIYLSLFAAVIAAVVAMFSNVGSEESLIIIASRAFFKLLYGPTFLFLMILMSAIILFGVVKLFGTIGTVSVRTLILFFAVFVFPIGGSLVPLGEYQPEPTLIYLVVFAVLSVISLTYHLYKVLSMRTALLKEKAKKCLLVFPYVILSIFSAMSLVLAMVQYFNPSIKAEVVLKVCSVVDYLYVYPDFYLVLVGGSEARTRDSRASTK